MLKKYKSVILCAAIFICAVVCVGVSLNRPSEAVTEKNDAASVIAQSNESSEGTDKIIETIDEWLVTEMPKEGFKEYEEKPWKRFEETSPEFNVFDYEFNEANHSRRFQEYLNIYKEHLVNSAKAEAAEEVGGVDVINVIIVSLLAVIAVGASAALIYTTSELSKWKRKYRNKHSRSADKIRSSEEQEDNSFIAEVENERAEFENARLRDALNAGRERVKLLETSLREKENNIAELEADLARMRYNYNIEVQQRELQKAEKAAEPIAPKKTIKPEEKPIAETPVKQQVEAGRRCNLKMVNGGVKITDGQYVVIKELDGGNTVQAYPSELAADRSVRNAISMFFDFKGYEGQTVTTISPCVLKKTAYNYVIEKKGYVEIT